VTISKSKIAVVTELALKHLHRYKDIVHYVEKFIRKGKTVNNTKLPQLYMIDSICRAELREKKGKKFIKRFGRNIDKSFHAFQRGPDSDKPALKRVFSLWAKEKWFDSAKMKAIIRVAQGFKDDKERHSERETPSSSKKKSRKHKHSRKKHKHRSKDRDRRRKDKDAHKDKASVTPDGGAAESGQNDGLLASLRSLTNQASDTQATSALADDDEAPESDEEDMQIKMERLKAKRKLADTSLAEPAAKKMKMDTESAPAPASASTSTSASAPVPAPAPAPAQPVQPVYPPNAPYPQHPMQPMRGAHPMQMMAMPGMAPPMMRPPHAPYMHAPHPSMMQQHPPPHQPHAQGSRASRGYPSEPERGVGWELAPDQSHVPMDRYRVSSCTLYIGFWNDVHVDVEKLRKESAEFGTVLKVMPHPSKPPHKHAFVQFGARSFAEAAKNGLRARFNELQFVQKVGWGRPPKLIKETFKFDSGIGEILRHEAPQIAHARTQMQMPPPPPPRMQQPQQQQQQQALQTAGGNGNGSANPHMFVNSERQNMIAAAPHPHAYPYGQPAAMPYPQYAQYPMQQMPAPYPPYQ